MAWDLRGQALRTTERVLHGWARERDWRLPEHFTADWEPLPDYNRTGRPTRSGPTASRSGTSSSGPGWPLHLRAAVERAARLAARGRRRPVRRGGDARLGGRRARRFPVHARLGRPPVVGARMHWVLCEAVAAAAVLAAVTGEPGTATLAERWRAHGDAVFADPATGSWHHELTATGEVGSATWAGQPDAYHLAQMLLLDGRPVRGSLAAALR